MKDVIDHKLTRPLTHEERKRCEIMLSSLEAWWGYKLELMVLASRKNPNEIYGFQFGRLR